MSILNKIKSRLIYFLEIDCLKTVYFRVRFNLPSNVHFNICPQSIIKISESAELKILNGQFRINASWTSGRARRNKSELILCENSKLIIESDFYMYQGASIFVAPNATLKIKGGWSFMNTNTILNCFEYIEIGSGVYISDNVSIQDSDNHIIIGQELKMTQPIIIKDHVWIGKNVTILKGVLIGEGAIVGAGSVVTKSVLPGTVVAGNPARVIKENIQWK